MFNLRRDRKTRRKEKYLHNTCNEALKEEVLVDFLYVIIEEEGY